MISFIGPRSGRRVTFVGLSRADLEGLLTGEMLETSLSDEFVCVLLRPTDSDLERQIEEWYPATGPVLRFLAAENAETGEPAAAMSTEAGGWKARAQNGGGR